MLPHRFLSNRLALTGILFLIALSCLSAPSATGADFDPRAVALLEKYVEATGGAEAYEAIQTRVIQGELSMPSRGVTGTMMTIYERPHRFHSEVNTSAGKQRRGSNGKTVWMIERAHGPRILTGLERALVLRDGTLDRFAHWRELAKSVTYVGDEEVNGRQCGKVVLTYQDPELRAKEAPVTIYLDRATGLIHQYGTKVSSPGMLANVDVVLEEYEKEGTILLPHKMKLKADKVLRCVTTLTEVKNNVPIPGFQLPREIQKLIVQGKKE